MKKMLSRRAILRGSLLGLPVGLGLPVLDAMLDPNGDALAATGDPLPVRFGTWFWGGGVVRSDMFFPATAGGPGWQPTAMMQPLARVTDYLTLVRGIRMLPKFPYSSGGHWYHRGYALANSYNTTQSQGYPGAPIAPSIDQVVAAAWKGATRFDSLQVGVLANGGVSRSTSFKANHAVLSPDTNPKTVFMRLFSDALSQPASAANFAAIQAAHKSLLDATMESGRALQARLGARDKSRIDSHIEALRDIERRLQAAPARTCSTPASPTVTGASPGANRADVEAINTALADLTVTALACDLTRVFSFMFSGAQDDTIYYQLGETSGWHENTHNGTYYQTRGPAVVTFIMKQLAYLVEKLKATPEGAGNLLDSLLLYGTSEFQDASAHSLDDHPFLLFGRAGGALAGGGYVRASGGPPVGAVMLACLQALGVTAAGVGNQSTDLDRSVYTTAALKGILKGT